MCWSVGMSNQGDKDVWQRHCSALWQLHQLTALSSHTAELQSQDIPRKHNKYLLRLPAGWSLLTQIRDVFIRLWVPWGVSLWDERAGVSNIRILHLNHGPPVLQCSTVVLISLTGCWLLAGLKHFLSDQQGVERHPLFSDTAVTLLWLSFWMTIH